MLTCSNSFTSFREFCPLPMKRPTDSPRSHVTKSTTTITTTAVQPVEITTTAVVGRPNEGGGARSSLDTGERDKKTESNGGNSQPHEEAGRSSGGKPARHQHHHFMKSPVFQPSSTSPLGSPLSSAGVVTPSTTTETIMFEQLPPPVDRISSEAIAALQDVANGKKENRLQRFASEINWIKYRITK